ncbi:MAG: hypothetical protein QM676_09200 [Novosphingobium sp.]
MAASAQFHAEILPKALEVLVGGEDVILAFPEADHSHRGWRLAVVRQLARDAAPLRVNALSGGDEAAIAAAVAYLAGAAGVTGQLLALAGDGAGEVLSPYS